MPLLRRRQAPLRILAPGKEHPAQTFFQTMALTLLICAVLSVIAIELVFLPQEDPEAEAARREAEAHPVDPLLTRAQQLATQSPDAMLRALPRWDQLTREAALAHGPRFAAELVCEDLFDGDSPPPPALLTRLTEAVQRQDEGSPSICTMTRYLRGEMAGERFEALAKASQQRWERFDRFEEPSLEVALLVNTWRSSGRTPLDRPHVARWLRRCAMHAELPSWHACVQTLAEAAPEQGEDLMMMAEAHLRELTTEPPPEDDALFEVLGLYGQLAREGSPDPWRVTQHPTLVRYDYDLRLGAVFQLCRFTMSTREPVAREAATQLAALIRTNKLIDDLKLARFRESCRIAFGGNHPDLEVVSLPEVKENHVPQLAVVSGSRENTPRYALQDLVARGHCAPSSELPLWYCGATLWKQEQTDISRAFLEAYVETRYMQWNDGWKTREVLAEEATAPAAAP